ncbi:MAG: Holliday junction resolvase RuvX [Gammaproteobacteria bacterium]
MPEPANSLHNSLLGFDFGSKKTGVATGQKITCSATELTTVVHQHGQPDWQQISALIKEWNPDALVVGIPYHMDGKSQPMTIRAEEFCRALENRFGLTVYRADERLTSYAAEPESVGSRAGIDAIAARIILQSWLYQETI